LTLAIRQAEPADVPLIADLIRQLARFEKLEQEVVLTEDLLTAGLFGARPYAEAVIAEDGGEPIGFALFFHTFSTFLARPGSTSRTCSCSPTTAGAESGARSWPTSLSSPSSAGVAAWSGRCSTGT
jgi:hypothetical protein